MAIFGFCTGRNAGTKWGKVICGAMIMLFSMLVIAATSEPTNSVLSVGAVKFKIMKVSLGAGLNAGGFLMAPEGIKKNQTCLLLEIENIVGEFSSLGAWVTDENGNKFDKSACLSKTRIENCAIAVDKSSKAFTLHFAKNDFVFDLKPLIK